MKLQRRSVIVLLALLCAALLLADQAEAGIGRGRRTRRSRFNRRRYGWTGTRRARVRTTYRPTLGGSSSASSSASSSSSSSSSSASQEQSQSQSSSSSQQDQQQPNDFKLANGETIDAFDNRLSELRLSETFRAMTMTAQRAFDKVKQQAMKHDSVGAVQMQLDLPRNGNGEIEWTRAVAEAKLLVNIGLQRKTGVMNRRGLPGGGPAGPVKAQYRMGPPVMSDHRPMSKEKRSQRANPPLMKKPHHKLEDRWQQEARKQVDPTALLEQQADKQERIVNLQPMKSATSAEANNGNHQQQQRQSTMAANLAAAVARLPEQYVEAAKQLFNTMTLDPSEQRLIRFSKAPVFDVEIGHKRRHGHEVWQDDPATSKPTVQPGMATDSCPNDRNFGTIGAIVERRKSGTYFAMSAAHTWPVPADVAGCQSGLQPRSRYEFPNPSEQPENPTSEWRPFSMQSLSRTDVLRWDTNDAIAKMSMLNDTAYDVAAVRVNTARTEVKCEHLGVPKGEHVTGVRKLTSSYNYRSPKNLGLVVQKYGAATGLTHGVIVGFSTVKKNVPVYDEQGHETERTRSLVLSGFSVRGISEPKPKNLANDYDGTFRYPYYAGVPTWESMGHIPFTHEQAANDRTHPWDTKLISAPGDSGASYLRKKRKGGSDWEMVGLHWGAMWQQEPDAKGKWYKLGMAIPFRSILDLHNTNDGAYDVDLELCTK